MADSSGKKSRIAIVGGGLVGAMQACYMAQRGYTVDLYESREDIRRAEHVAGRSINLALSVRGRSALRHIGLEEEVVKSGIPMHARLIHSLDGKKSAQPYGTKGEAILSVDRRKLNELLLSAAEKVESVTMHFHHRLSQLDLDNGILHFTDKNDHKVEAHADLIFGCDGAYSCVRRQLMRKTLIDFSQEYIPHGYMELCVPPVPGTDGQHNMEINYLHIWPRNEFMMIALPNQDGSFTLTLFMPFKEFEGIKAQGDEGVLAFFEKYFPDAIEKIGVQSLKETYNSSTHLPLVSIKCSPYHYQDKAVIMGDASHAMVPFYGQGMNCGFEDCLVFNEIMDQFDGDFAKVLPHYSTFRGPDAKAICDLAMYNYVEMRSLVNSRWFLFRKKVDWLLNWFLPSKYIPLYSMVTFSRIRYHMVINKWKKQDKIVNNGLILLGLSSLGMLVWLISRGRQMQIGKLTEMLTERIQDFF
ncbi:kynurenine 3-monooxygenase [Strongylocentrotus purpuratus]|uniref:Kynurenine 3-monooxygenase n=1 Tax=Strongylocentrotus purpuratus TaxID=7668 RepID=A0A7M7RF57_STRPU|nr:kynurenine 3-monooxygenase [Strongylocentrotus purpuratus]|eukprot:XP_796984.1 PREDICTED: kynurenine 3-monooxygenase [Strongylocentrotus purpuratus]